MNLAFFLTLAIASGLLTLSAYTQLLYLESLRLRTRDYAAFDYFKENIEDRLGLKIERGALTFSLLKHALIALMGVFALALLGTGRQQFWTAAAEAALLSWALATLFAHILPQTLYRHTAGRWLFAFLPALHVMAIAMTPVTATLKFLQSLTELRNNPAEEAQDSAESVEALITAGAEEGLIEEGDRNLIRSVVEFGDKTVHEVMTPRPRIVAIEKSRSLDDLRKLVINEQFSRVPVFDGTIDHMVGFVHVRDMFERNPEERSGKVWELMRPILKVPEQAKIDKLFTDMQRNRTHMAVVVDEYGSTAGLCTMEDLVEEILGEIRDEHEPTQDVSPDGEGIWVASGSFDLDHLRELVDFRPEAEIESTTVGGLVAEWLGRVPRVGETAQRDGIRLEVIAANDRRVDRVRIMRAQPEQEEAPIAKEEKDA